MKPDKARKCYARIIDRKTVKLSRLLLVSDRDWREVLTEAGLKRPKMRPGEISTFSQASSSNNGSVRRHPEQPGVLARRKSLTGSAWVSQGFDLDLW